MKTRVGIIACMISFAFLLTAPSALAQADKLIGVWKLVEVKLPQMGDRDAQTMANPQPSLIIFTKKYYSLVEVRGDKARPDLPENATAEQIAGSIRQFVANSGTYEVKGSTITRLPIVAKSPNWMNSPHPESEDFRFEGDSLIILYKPSPKLPAPIELKYTRLE
jgi:hypothetical protein